MPRLAVVPELESELDRLYALPLDQFTAARNELATRLNKAGQTDAAETVRALRKPSVAVWTVNQLARRHADEVAALVAAGERLRHAQQQAFLGEGAEGVRAATADERAAVRTLTRLAEGLLEGEGRSASQQTIEKVAATLRAAAVDPEAAPLLATGRLAEEAGAVGFDALSSLAPPPTVAGARGRAGEQSAERVGRREQRERVRRLRKRAEQLRRRAEEAEAKAVRAEQARDEARAAADTARAEAEGAAAELAEAEAEAD